MTSTSTGHRATVDHLCLIKAAWAEIVPLLPPTLTGHQMDRYWYRTYIAAVRTGAPNPAAIAAEVMATPTPPRTPEHDPGTQPPRTPTVEHLTAEILGSPLPPETPERCTHRNQEEGNPC